MEAGEGDNSSIENWQYVYDELIAVPRAELDASELDKLADALFWLDRTQESIDARMDAFRSHSEQGQIEPAALSAWRLFYDHFLVGELAPANGWLGRCRRLADSDGLSGGWFAIAEADSLMARGEFAQAVKRAGRARELAAAVDCPDLSAMALQCEGRALIGAGDRRKGTGLLDEAMVILISERVSSLYVGWVYCNVISTCYGLADLKRASEWSEAAMRWCASLQHGYLYPGLCRVYSAELACLRGMWGQAQAEAERACMELESHDPRYAGSAHYLVGEIRRLKGELAEAEASFVRASELGHDPIPGIALVRMARGDHSNALASLRSALHPGPSQPLPRSQILGALIEVAEAVNDVDTLQAAAEEIAVMAAEVSSQIMWARAHGAKGRQLLANRDLLASLAELRNAYALYDELGVPYDVAKYRELAGLAADRSGDADTALVDYRLALDTFERLGAKADAKRVRLHLAGVTPTPEASSDDLGVMRSPLPQSQALSTREIEVLTLVSGGCTNREIGDRLFISHHTVSRHLSNIFAKLNAGSRAAAVAIAYERGLLK